jgi:hypothetical protein
MLGVNYRPPHFHNGSAQTLTDVFAVHRVAGQTIDTLLGAADKADLLAFLQFIDGRTNIFESQADRSRIRSKPSRSRVGPTRGRPRRRRLGSPVDRGTQLVEAEEAREMEGRAARGQPFATRLLGTGGVGTLSAAAVSSSVMWRSASPRSFHSSEERLAAILPFVREHEVRLRMWSGLRHGPPQPRPPLLPLQGPTVARVHRPRLSAPSRRSWRWRSARRRRSMTCWQRSVRR